MNEEEFGELVGSGHEVGGVEFKGPGLASDKQLFAKVVRAILGMANRRDGGLVVLGVKDAGGKRPRLEAAAERRQDPFRIPRTAG